MNTTPFLLQSSLCSILYPCVSQTHTHTVRRHLCHARRIYLKVKRSFTQRKWGRLRCPVPSSPSQRQRQHQHQRTRTDRRWLASRSTDTPPPRRPRKTRSLERRRRQQIHTPPPRRSKSCLLLDRPAGNASRLVVLSLYRFHSSRDSGATDSCGLGSRKG